MNARRFWTGLWLGLSLVFKLTAMAHDGRPAFLEITEASPGYYEVLWRTPVTGGVALPVSLKRPGGVTDVKQPLVQEFPDSRIERRTWQSAGPLDGKRIEIDGLQGTIADVLVRVHLHDGRQFTVLVHPSQPWMELAARQSASEVIGGYIMHGIRHIAFGPDHLLFVFGLILIVKSRWMLLKTVTAFTVAHSITLTIATLGYATPPIPPIETSIALSILFLGPEIVRSWRGQTSLTLRHPWVVAFLFGCIHGFGFASAMTEAGLARSELPLALLSFNVGVEIGQVGFVVLIILLERSLRRLEVAWPRWAYAVPGYVVGSVGAFWTIQRTAILLGFMK